MYSREVPAMQARLFPEEVSALRSVNVHIYGGIHGIKQNIEPFGLACTGVVDDDYGAMERLVNSLEPGHDVLAHEAMWHDPAHDEAWLLGEWRRAAQESVLLDVEPFDLRAFAQQARDAMVINPQDYAQTLAMTRGIRVEYADATRSDEDYLKGNQSYVNMYRGISYRDARMVERLGSIAATMNIDVPRKDRPTLAMVTGYSHFAGIKRNLPSNLLWRPKMRRYSQNMSQRYYEGIREETDIHVDRWVENARRIMAARS